MHIHILSKLTNNSTKIITRMSNTSQRQSQHSTSTCKIIKDLNKIIIEGNIEKLIKLYNKETNLDSTSNGATPLGIAIQHNKPLIAKLLIHLGAEVDKRTSITTPNNNGHICTNLTELNNRNHTCRNINETPLIASIKLENFEIFETLISNGADLRTTSQTGLSPIWIAATTGNLIFVKTLLENKAPIKFNNYTTNPVSVLSHFLKNSLIIIETPKDYLVAPRLFNFRATYREELIELIIAGVDYSQTDSNGIDPLLWTIKHADLGLTILLLKAGAKFCHKHPWLQKENLPILWQTNERLSNWIFKKAKNPPSLKRLSGTNIRTNIKNNTNFDVRITIDKLELPTILKQYLKLNKPTSTARSIKPTMTWSDQSPFLPHQQLPMPISNWSMLKPPYPEPVKYKIQNDIIVHLPSCPLLYLKLSPPLHIPKGKDLTHVKPNLRKNRTNNKNI